MSKIAPLTKLIFTLVVSIWAFIMQDITQLTVLVAAVLVIIGLAGLRRKTWITVASLAFFAATMAVVQLLAGMSVIIAAIGSLRMLVMTYAFLYLLGSTRMQDLTAALVKQCRVPYDFAFLFTASLRFIPDMLSEFKAVQEAQACRGYVSKGNYFRRLISYLSIVQPLVLRSISRSETMAMSLELRGYGGATRSFVTNVGLGSLDYFLCISMSLLTGIIIIYR